MKKKRASKKVNTAADKIQNDINPGIGGGINPTGFPYNQGSGFSEQASQANTLFKNLRWYLVSNFRQMLSEAYVEIGLIQTICQVPVQDALKGGIEISSKELSEDQISLLSSSLDRDDDLSTIGQAEVWNRLYGGAGILVLTDQDPEEPLDLENIDKDTPLEFRAVDMWELYWDKQNTEGYDATLQQEDFDYYSYYGEPVHKSRVMRLKGMTAPSFIRPRLRGWGFSVVEALVRSINQYLKATDLTFEVLDEFKVDVYKVKNLVNTLLSPLGQQQVRERFQTANYLKNYQNAIVLDTEDDWDHKQLSFSGLAEAMAGIRMQVASDMRMPLTKLFGISSSGFNSGEDDIEVYNAMVEGSIRNKIKYPILRILEIKCQKMLGFIPSDLSISFKPLREMSSEQQENVKTQKFNRLKESASMGLITAEEFRDACNRGDLFDIQLADVPPNYTGYDDDTITEGQNNPYNPQDTNNPGADREDTRKSRAFDKGGIGKDIEKAPPIQADKSRAKAQLQRSPVLRNSALFDKASYEADGGDAWIDARRIYFFEKPSDPGLYATSKQRMREAGYDSWQAATWLYLKEGGKFHGNNI